MKVGITFSAFDLFHAGHVKMLEEPKTSFDIGLKRIINWYLND
jgi:glycerol-3-phosphate cytidylyltransferase-like family protein